MASQIDIECPHCGGEITIDREWIGQKGECPYCNRKFMLSEPGSEQDKRTADMPHSLNKVAGKSSFCGNSMMWKIFLLGIAVGSLIASLIVLGFVFLWDSKSIIEEKRDLKESEETRDSKEASRESRVNSIVDNGHKGVQLWKDGPYWAETNIGAEEPWESGYYFWWGDTVGYKRENYAWAASDGSSSNFEFDRKNVFTQGRDLKDLHRKGWTRENGMLTPEHDAAHVHWGGEWRMPTVQELIDLCKKCDWSWTPVNGVNGYSVRGRGAYASASIFLPCTGRGLGTSLDGAGLYGPYWSSVPGSDDYGAWWFGFDSNNNHTYYYGRRFYGQSVRPVQGFTK